MSEVSIHIENGIYTRVDLEYLPKLMGARFSKLSVQDNKSYVCLYFDGINIPKYLNRHIMSLTLGRTLESWEWVDHRDGDSLNNLKENLRLCIPAQNSQNRKKSKRNTSGFKGVDLRPSGRYRAQISVNWSYKYLGTYPTAEEAAKAYDTAAKEYHKEFAVLNFP